MGVRPHNVRSRIRTVVVAALLLTTAAGFYYAAYSLGRTSFEEMSQRKLRSLEIQVQSKRSVKENCLSISKKFKQGNLEAEELEKRLEADARSLLDSSAALRDGIVVRQRRLSECQAAIKSMVLEKEGAVMDASEVTELEEAYRKGSAQLEAAAALGALLRIAQSTSRRAALKRKLEALAAARQTSVQCPHDGYMYNVVFDIGSTGNRVHAFKFRVRNDAPLGVDASPPTLAHLELVESLFRINEVGLSTFADPATAVASLNDLFAEAEKYVPSEHRRCTPVQFKATAGLRKTSKAFANAVLDGIRQHFGAQKTLWLRGQTPARILEGGEEGPLAWLTVNYLLGNFQADGTKQAPRAAIIDLGGGSAQVVFEPPNGTLTGRSLSLLFNSTINGQVVEAYQHSYEGLGMIAATEQLMQSVLGQCGLEPPVAVSWNISADLDRSDQRQEEELYAYHRQHFPCFPVGYREPSTGVENAATDSNNDGTTPTRSARGASFDECALLFQSAVLRDWIACRETTCGVWGVYQPSLASFSGDIFAFSFIYDILKPFFEPGAAVGRFTVDQLSTIGRRVCSELTLESIVEEQSVAVANTNGTNARPRALQPQRMCMYHAYVYALLREGLKVPSEAVLRVEKKINGFEASWALGAALREM